MSQVYYQLDSVAVIHWLKEYQLTIYMLILCGMTIEIGLDTNLLAYVTQNKENHMQHGFAGSLAYANGCNIFDR